MFVSTRVEIGLGAMPGTPVTRGNCMRLKQILLQLRPGAGENDALPSCPRLDNADIRTAITYAADRLAHKGTVLVWPKRQMRFL